MSENGMTFVIADIHGCLNMLKRLLEKVKCSPTKDKLIFVGGLR